MFDEKRGVTVKKTGAQIVLQSLQIEGVKAVFGYPGGAVINLYDELPNYKIKHYLVRHEQAAVHAADGYARATGEVGVALVTSGPGATNTVTGLATAYMDSIPLVVFTGQVPTALIGNDAFQEADIVGITRPCTKHNYLVKDVKDLPRIIKEAFHIARSGRPGPVLVDLPKDVLVAIGARFDDRVTGRIDEFAPGAKIIHIDIDPTSISKNVKVDIPIVGDVRDVLAKMLVIVNEMSEEVNEFARAHGDWLAKIAKWRDMHRLDYIQEEVIKPQYVVEKICELTRGQNPIISTEVGQNQMWAAQFYEFTRPRTWLTSGGLGTMGYGFPAALGAQVAFPDRLVIDIAGDGSIQMNIQELATVVQYQLPVKVIILNNGYLGMVRQWQELFFRKHYSATDMSVAPDFVKLAEAYGAVGLRATKPNEVESTLKKAFAIDRPVFVEFIVAREENVYPMVPAGEPISKMLLV